MLKQSAVAAILCLVAGAPVEAGAQMGPASTADASAASASGRAQPEGAAVRMPQALDALTRMGKFLRTLTVFEVSADGSTDVVLDNGQNAGFLHHTDLKVQEPDRLRAEITGSRHDRGLVYDGRSFTIFNNSAGYYTRNPAPDTIDGLVQVLATTWNVEAPLADLFYWGNGKVDDLALTSAQVIGPERIDSRWCIHYAYQQSGVDWELWIQSGSKPLPCRMVIADTTQPSRSQ